MVCQVVVCGVMGRDSPFDADVKKTTVKQLKEVIAKKFPAIPGEDSVRLIFEDKALDNNTKLLSDYGVQHKSLIQMVMKLSGGLTA